MKERRPRPAPDVSNEPLQPGAGVFVLGLWAVLSASALAFVVRYGPSFPVWDDFEMVPALTGARRVTAAWLWDQHNEHRVPVPKSILLALLRLSGGDFRAGMIFNVVGLSALSLGTILVARRSAGRWRETDAFFPILLLHLGHHANLLWAWQVQFVLSTILAGGLLLLIVSGEGWPRSWRAVLAGALLALLPLCGANGAALVPAMAGWLLLAAAAHLARGEKRDGLLNLIAAAVSLLIVVSYFRGYRAAGHHRVDGDLAASLVTALQFLSLMLGPSAALLWPYSGALVVLLLVSSVAISARAAIRRPEERPRVLGLLAFLAGIGSLALGLGWGRAGASPLGGFEPRYVTLAAPMGLAIYLLWDLCGDPPWIRRLVLTCLFATMLVVSWPNTQAGIVGGKRLAEQAARLERDIRSGMPTFQVIRRHNPFLHPSQDELATLLPMLRDARIGVFRHLRPDPPFREVAVPVIPAEVRLARWKDGTAQVTGVDPRLVFVLPEAQYVAGIHIRYAHSNPEGTPARFRMGWRHPGQTEAPPEQSYANWYLPTGRDRTTTVWVGEVIREFEIQPDNQPCEFHIASITLLISEL